ncbi:hypothetical protein O181_052756 [Austropuccinia psidii MF-1]|uniref:CCHC-type domain-containing protein n=1 Tax=Austropuccinia psidii MF-1 TaxID=1389203 RepID=A0A9Q3HPJ4_9BASI|nr:hypothetical protein [Austropuccinia psidii MF-1]
MKNHKLLTKLPGELEHEVKCICLKESTLKEVRIRACIGRYNTNFTGDNMDNPTLEAKEAHYSEVEMKKECHNCGSHNHYSDNCPKDSKEILPKEEKTIKDKEGSEYDSNSVLNGCGDDSYSESNLIEQYLVEFEDHDFMEIRPVHSTRWKLITKNLV